jgi:diguanylate cyclase (GGDEF)-like protein
MRQSFMVFCLDLDGFKDVNDRYGHSAGDAILAEVARRLTDSVRTLDCVARIGGDEFVILLPSITPQEADAVAKRIIAMIASAFDIGLTTVHIGVSIGCACAPDDGDTVEQLLRSADRALYEAKRRGRGMLVHHGALNVVELVPALDADAAMAKLACRDPRPHHAAPPIQTRSVV